MQHRDARSAKALNTGELTFREDVERSARPRDGRGCLHEAVLHPQRPLGAHIAASAIGIAIARQGMPGAGCRRWNRNDGIALPGNAAIVRCPADWRSDRAHTAKPPVRTR